MQQRRRLLCVLMRQQHPAWRYSPPARYGSLLLHTKAEARCMAARFRLDALLRRPVWQVRNNWPSDREQLELIGACLTNLRSLSHCPCSSGVSMLAIRISPPAGLPTESPSIALRIG